MVDEDLYTFKINCKGKRTVGKANKGINVEKYNRFKKLKFKKRWKKNEEERKKGEKKENSTELQKPNVEAEVYNNRKCDWVYTYTYIPMRKVKTNQEK